jgi:hypothetical protein
MKPATLTLTLFALGLAGLAGCAGDDAAGMAAPDEQPPPSSEQPVIEEPDLYKLVGDLLFVQNPSTGFNIIDVKSPTQPKLLGHAPSSSGAGAEMYIRGDQSALVLLKAVSGACRVPDGVNFADWIQGSELLMINHTDKTQPTVVERYCLPGNLVASRTVDQVLYLVQSKTSQPDSQAISLDITNPEQVRLVQQLPFTDATSKEIKVTAEAIFVAAEVQGYPRSTDLSYIAINKTGAMTLKGTINLEGTPQGRFHMDVRGSQFRIVTYNEMNSETLLYVVDISDPSNLNVLGKLSDIGRWEKLYATRFDGDLVYIVTFRQTDPMWVVSLADPAQPQVIGELHVPGWSDFIFPRGNRLITVGRGDNGGSLGLSLFDVSNPANPTALDQITLGDPATTSEANVDHRAVTILERPGANPVVVVPHTTVSWQTGCQLVDRVQLVEVTENGLQARGGIQQSGTTRRTLLVQPQLYSISDEEVVAIDINDLDNPAVKARIALGPEATNPNASQYCSEWNSWDQYREGYYYDDYEPGGFYMWKCSVGAGEGGSLPPLTVVFGLLWLGVWISRRSRR